jgi:hypothetical protein
MPVSFATTPAALLAIAVAVAGCADTDLPTSATPSPTTVSVALAGERDRQGIVSRFEPRDAVTVRMSLHPPLPRRRLLVQVGRKNEGVWASAYRTTLVTRPDGTAALRARNLTPGAYRVSVRYPGDATHAGAVSPWRYFVVAGS